jgi:ABC-type nitrate/sulfonate/bicarbonate transport system substrate-binding protein
VNPIKHLYIHTLTLLLLVGAYPLSAAQANTPLMTGVAGPAINLVYALLTKDAGLWQKHGLDARAVVFESESILAQAALSGEVKFSISSGPATIASRVQGADTIILAAMVNILPYSIVAAKNFQAKKQGYQILVNIADLKIPYPQLVVETTERYLKENPQTVKSFLKGFIEGVHYAANHKDETKKIMIKDLKTVDPEILDVTYQDFLQTTDYSGRPNLDGIRNAMDEVAARVPAVKSRKPEEFVDTPLLRELEKEGFFKQF